MMTVNQLLGIFSNYGPYRWEKLAFNGNVARKSGRVKGMRKSIYHNWGYNDSPYYIHLSKAERKGKSWQETQKMRMGIFKKRSKR
jgi:hypothetical protein